MGGWGWLRRAPSLWESRVSERHHVLIGRPASPAEPAALPPNPQARRVLELKVGNRWRQEVKMNYSGFTGRGKRKGQDLMRLKVGLPFKEISCHCSGFKLGADQSSMGREWGRLPSSLLSTNISCQSEGWILGSHQETKGCDPCCKGDENRYWGHLPDLEVQGRRPGGSGFSEGLERMSDVNQKKLGRVLQMEGAADTEAQR